MIEIGFGINSSALGDGKSQRTPDRTIVQPWVDRFIGNWKFGAADAEVALLSPKCPTMQTFDNA